MSSLMSSPPRPSSETAPASAQNTDAATARPSATARRALHCERCGYEWFSRIASPVRCPSCASKSWNKARVYQLEGKPEPTIKPKARGASFTSETAQEAAQIRHHGESEAKEKPLATEEI